MSRPPICIMMTAYGSVDVAVEAMKRGAYDFVTKPLNLDKVELLIVRAMQSRKLEQENRALREQVDERYGLENIWGDSPALREVLETVKQVAPSSANVLIEGESGTGKELAAHAIHNLSRRNKAKFVTVHCAALSPQLLESELFGHEKGAFTGAITTKQGLLEIAHRGTVFLDEIGDMDSQVQASLLKVLEEKRFRRLGDVKDRSVDVRLIAATHRDLRVLVEQQRFRQDLYYRICTLELFVPALRERRGDVPLIASRILHRLARDLGRQPVTLADDAERVLSRYDWPGNIRELRNVLERALLRTEAARLEASMFAMPSDMAAQPSAMIPVRRSGTLDDVEKEYIEEVLREENGVIDRVAARLGVSRSAVYYKARKHGIEIAKIRG
jgi:DNA-binding NtrC family response regulator